MPDPEWAARHILQMTRAIGLRRVSMVLAPIPFGPYVTALGEGCSFEIPEDEA